MNNTADSYRDRPSGEILKEQTQLESLKRLSKIKGGAWWEWDAADHKFTVSSEWQKLTGYAAEDIFPMNLSKHTPIEGLLDNFIGQWLELVHPKDQAKAEKKVKSFFYGRRTNYFEFGYRIRFANGSYRRVLTVARSVWIDSRLTSLFVRMQDIEQWADPTTSAVQIAKSKEEIKQQNVKIKELSSTLSTVIRSAAPMVLAAFIALNEVVGPIIKEIKKTFDLIIDPPAIEGLPNNSMDDAIFFSNISPEVSKEIDDVLRSYSTYGDSVRLAAYTPAYLSKSYPYQYQYIAQASNDESYHADSSPQSATLNEGARNRTNDHANKRTHLWVNGNNHRYSVPFTIVRDDGRNQDFFVEIVKDGSADGLSAMQSAADSLAGKIKTILQQSASADIVVDGVN